MNSSIFNIFVFCKLFCVGIDKLSFKIFNKNFHLQKGIYILFHDQQLCMIIEI